MNAELNVIIAQQQIADLRRTAARERLVRDGRPAVKAHVQRQPRRRRPGRAPASTGQRAS